MASALPSKVRGPEVALRLRKVISLTGWSDREFAKRLGVSRSLVCRVLRESRSIGPTLIHMLYVKMNLRPDYWLAPGDPDPKGFMRGADQRHGPIDLNTPLDENTDGFVRLFESLGADGGTFLDAGDRIRQLRREHAADPYRHAVQRFIAILRRRCPDIADRVIAELLAEVL